ncbi:MAG: hypothetical protein ACOCU6_03550 [Nanoarchaeota archaeon]
MVRDRQSGNEYRIDKDSLNRLELLTSSIVKTSTLLFSISKERHAVIRCIEDHYQKNGFSGFSKKDMDTLRWCVRNEKRVLDTIRPGFEREGQRFLSLYVHIRKSLNNSKSLYEELTDRHLRRASKVMYSFLPHMKSIMESFKIDLARLEKRIAKEEEFLEHRSTATAKDLFKMWELELKIEAKYKKKISDLASVADMLRKEGVLKLVAGSVLGMGGGFLLKPDIPNPDNMTVLILGYCFCAFALLTGLSDVFAGVYVNKRKDLVGIASYDKKKA